MALKKHGRRPQLLRPPRSGHRHTGRLSPPYDRRTTLPRVLPVWPHELEDTSAAGRCKLIAKLRRALRAERRRGIAGHWTYDLARHAELLRVYRAELALTANTERFDIEAAQPRSIGSDRPTGTAEPRERTGRRA